MCVTYAIIETTKDGKTTVSVNFIKGKPDVINCDVDFSEIEKKIEELNREVDNKVSRLKEKNKELEKENEQFNDILCEYEFNLEKRKTQCKKLKSEIARLESENEMLSNLVSFSSKHITLDLKEKKILELVDENTKLKSENARLEGVIDDMRTHHKGLVETNQFLAKKMGYM